MSAQFDSRKPISFVEKLVVRLMGLVERFTSGFPVPREFIEEIVRRHGLRGLKELNKIEETIAVLAKRFGEADGQTLIAFAALRLGCTYCSRAHLLTANLVRFHDSGELFPISESDMLRLARLRDEELMAAVREKLSEPRYAKLLGLLERQYQLERSEGDPTPQPDDPFLKLASTSWSWMTECSIITYEQPLFFPSHSTRKVVKDKALLARYQQARAQAEQAASATSTAQAAQKSG